MYIKPNIKTRPFQKCEVLLFIIDRNSSPCTCRASHPTSRRAATGLSAGWSIILVWTHRHLIYLGTEIFTSFSVKPIKGIWEKSLYGCSWNKTYHEHEWNYITLFILMIFHDDRWLHNLMPQSKCKLLWKDVLTCSWTLHKCCFRLTIIFTGILKHVNINIMRE